MKRSLPLMRTVVAGLFLLCVTQSLAQVEVASDGSDKQIVLSKLSPPVYPRWRECLVFREMWI